MKDAGMPAPETESYEPELDGDGDCYEVAANIVVESTHCPDDFRVRLVHGRPRLQRPPYCRFGHAWVEFTLHNGTTMVTDNSNGHNVTIDAQTYYEVGHIEPDKCIRYSRQETIHHMLMFKHYGPWHEEETPR